MSIETGKSPAKPVFARCVRCDYSLRGLPANHACPECGLRFDEKCELYRVTNPKSAFFILVCLTGGTTGMMRGLQNLFNWQSASAWGKVWAVMAVLWFVFVAILAWKLYKIYRRGQFAAVTTEGLIIHMVGFKDKLIPWADITEATVKSKPKDKAQVAAVELRNRAGTKSIGGVYNVFPTRAHVERFVDQVNERIRIASESSTEAT